VKGRRVVRGRRVEGRRSLMLIVVTERGVVVCGRRRCCEKVAVFNYEVVANVDERREENQSCRVRV